LNLLEPMNDGFGLLFAAQKNAEYFCVFIFLALDIYFITIFNAVVLVLSPTYG
jgi:hypothetical protein